ncbi:hypothetical protein JNL27_10840 [bacterium]|nr:hypothetical protein [bacterium]
MEMKFDKSPKRDDTDFEAALNSLSQANSFVVFTLDEHNFMQVTGNVTSGFYIEYKTPAEHFCSVRKDLAFATVLKIITAFSQYNFEWKKTLRWTTLDGETDDLLSLFRNIAIVTSILTVISYFLYRYEAKWFVSFFKSYSIEPLNFVLLVCGVSAVTWIPTTYYEMMNENTSGVQRFRSGLLLLTGIGAFVVLFFKTLQTIWNMLF